MARAGQGNCAGSIPLAISRPSAKPAIMRVWLVSFTLLAWLVGGCARKPELPKEVRERYQKDAARLCHAIVDCIKEDVSRQLAKAPERRDMVLGRMTREHCVENQYRLIGDLSVGMQPGKIKIEFDPKLYELYSQCSQTVAGATTCHERKRLHREAPSCVQLRTEATRRLEVR